MGTILDNIAAEIAADRDALQRSETRRAEAERAAADLSVENEGLANELVDAMSRLSAASATIEALRTENDGLRDDITVLQAALAACQAGGGGNGGGGDPDPEEPLGPLMVPTGGKILIGSTDPSASLGGGTLSYKAVTGLDPAIYHSYATSASQFQTRLNSTPAGTIPFINFKPVGTMGPQAYADILAGKGDAAMRSVAAAITSYGKPVFIAIMHEPENDDKAGTSDAEYAKAFRRCVGFLPRNLAVVVWNMMSYYGWGNRLNTLYPGDDVVDWIAGDPYAHTNDIDTFRKLVNRTHSSVPGYPGFYEWAKPKNKPIMLAEWGIQQDVHATLPQRLLTAVELDRMRSEMPLVKALVYWNSLTKKADGSVENDYRFQAFPQVWSAFVRSPHFDVDISAVTK